MAIAPILKGQVERSVRSRGEQYFHQHRVSIVSKSPDNVVAEVRGSRHYEVGLYREEDALVASCSCPYFEGGLACKHIWATILEADRQNTLQGDGDNAGLFLDVDFDTDDDYDADPEEEDVGPWDGRRSRRAVPVAPPVVKVLQNNPSAKTKTAASWQEVMQRLRTVQAGPDRITPDNRRLFYVLDDQHPHGDSLSVGIFVRWAAYGNEWSEPQSLTLRDSDLKAMSNETDRTILALVRAKSGHAHLDYLNSSFHDFRLTAEAARGLMPMLCDSGRCVLGSVFGGKKETPLVWDRGGPWTFQVRVEKATKTLYDVRGVLRRGDESSDLAKVAMLLPGLVLWPDHAATLSLAPGTHFEWVAAFHKQPSVRVPEKEINVWLQQFYLLDQAPPLELPEELRVETVAPAPTPVARVRAGDGYGSRLSVDLVFDYAGQRTASGERGRLFNPETRQLIERDTEAELLALRRLSTLDLLRRSSDFHVVRFEIGPRNLPKLVPLLLSEGWKVEADGKLYRQPGAVDISVTSGIDWFDLHGTVEFDGMTVGLPLLLQALKRGENHVQLDDGSLGMLPEDWLKKYGVLAGLGQADKDSLRFRRNQVGLLDALLAAQPEARFDDAFQKARDELKNFDGVRPADPDGVFQGELRGYQRDGLGWLHFLRRFQFGGCLADDMGLGKTIQVLALLEALRRDGAGPSLVVVPKSLVFNWKQEAAKFTPELRVLDHTGVGRLKPGEHFRDYHVVLTTYGTLRRDAFEFKDQEFEYCILDEAQAVKNAKSESSKAARLIRSRHRLALTGTPVENHLGELWSLFDFLNPGMLGQASVLQLGGAGARNPEPETRALLSKALRPFLLRRTKEQVAKDLPTKTEQTLFADMPAKQKHLYDELRDHYRGSLLAKVAEVGLARSKMHVLEALLRLRQAACHPGLLDKARKKEPSAKLDLLLPQLKEIWEEGSKTLVFSQFTSFLGILKERLDAESVPYEYLDGKTRNRAEKVTRFQTDPDCKLFLISLKAGGLGLNLTAAEYVFLLDPWWNPAVEAQAIDRTHRIGQTRPVFAYRLITRGTVEEKVLELQKHKRELADAILNADNSLIRSLTREDLELLLG